MIPIESLDGWHTLLEQSDTSPIIIFKHSNTCPISEVAHKKLADAEHALSEAVNIVVVQTHREVSNAIGKDLAVQHESPQVLLVEKRAVVYSESHDSIDPNVLQSMMK